MATLALAGDTMLGRGVAQRLRADPRAALVAPEVARHIAAADTFLLNLECCISDRGSRFPDPAKPFFFRAPPVAAERLTELRVDAVTLANNHALDYGPDALLDTLAHLAAAGIATVGAGENEDTAHAHARLRCGELELRLVAFSDHPAYFAAGPQRPGIAFADLSSALPAWLENAVRGSRGADAVVVMPHWGPNMIAEPVDHVRRSAGALMDAGATLVAGHSAHVFQGVAPGVLFDLGDFLDDYAVDSTLRNDLGLLWLVELERGGVGSVRAVPLVLEYCFTREASASEADWILRRLQTLSGPFGIRAEARDGFIEFL